jgi:L-seryl-tRNA(Ser) seleniumtransferase
VIGSANLVARLKKHPLARALRADKLCLAALSATLMHYLKDEAEREIPIWRMITSTADQLHQKVESWAGQLEVGQVIPGQSTVGGGSLPGETLPTWLLAISTSSPNRLLDQLRCSNPPIIARLENDLVLLDPRTILEDQEQALLSRLGELVG